MSKIDEGIAGVGIAIAVVLGVVILWWTTPRLWGWWVRVWQNAQDFTHTYTVYCKDLKKITKADPIFEDNGKYEDESYRVTYEDGSVGLIDQAAMQSGYYCVSPKSIKDSEAAPEGWVLKP